VVCQDLRDVALFEFVDHLLASGRQGRFERKDPIDEIGSASGGGRGGTSRGRRRSRRQVAAEGNPALDDVPQLANVAWPGVVVPLNELRRGEGFLVTAELAPEMPREERDISAAPPERR
jgi:hypothetical protein